MKLVLERSGGVAGLRRPPLEVDTADLPVAARDRLRALVDAAHLAALPRQLDGGTPDQLGYALSVTDDSGARHTVEFSLSAAGPELRALVSEIRRLACVR